MEQLFIDRFIIEGFEKVGFDTFHSFEDENECDEISISFEINSINLLPSYFHEITKYVLEQYDNNLNETDIFCFETLNGQEFISNSVFSTKKLKNIFNIY